MHERAAYELQIADRRTADLEATVKSQRDELDKLPDEVKSEPAFVSLSQSNDVAQTLVAELGQANNAISQALSYGSTPLPLRVEQGRRYIISGGEVTEPTAAPEDKKTKG
jgi:hypothetical protein